MSNIIVTDKIAPPDDEEYGVILSALSSAKTQLHSLRVAKALEAQPAPASAQGRYPNLLAYLQRGNARRVEGKNLTAELEAAEAQVRVLEGLYDDWTARSDAWTEAQTVAAANPS